MRPPSSALLAGCGSDAKVSTADGGAACPVAHTRLLYAAPGCGAGAPMPMCLLEYACFQVACTCDGDLVVGCNEFAKPFAYRYPQGVMPDAGSCDPNTPPAN